MADVQFYWNLLGAGLSGVVIITMITSMLDSARTFFGWTRPAAVTIAVDSVVILLCMWAVWFVGRFW